MRKEILSVCFICALCVSVNAETVRVFSRDVCRLEETVKSDGKEYTMTLKNGMVYRLKNKEQYDLIRANWTYFRFLNVEVESTKL